jgi:hypothetical protein
LKNEPQNHPRPCASISQAELDAALRADWQGQNPFDVAGAAL